MKLTIFEFKNKILGIRYEEVENIQELFDLFTNEISRSYDIINAFTSNEHVNQNIQETESKDQYLSSVSTYILSRPVEVDLSLAYANTMIMFYPNFKEYCKPYLDKINDSDPLKRRIYKFLVNYTIGNIFRKKPDLAKTIRQYVVQEVDNFLVKFKLNDYVIQKKRDGVLLDIPFNFILSNLSEDPRFKVTEFKSVVLNYNDQRKQIYLTKDDKIDLKGVGLVPPGILDIYKRIIHCYLLNGYTDKRSFIAMKSVVFDFMNKFNIWNFAEEERDHYIVKLRKGTEITFTKQNSHLITRGFTCEHVNVMYYYKTYIESWIQTIIINSHS